jgi:hypothetical protein
MKQKLPVVSMFLLIALVLSLVPAAALPSRASAASASQACTDVAQFVTDVTVPDGTRYDAGATFTKTWRLRNIGTCTWTTAYTMVFDSGTQMGSNTSVNHPANTPPGASVEPDRAHHRRPLQRLLEIQECQWRDLRAWHGRQALVGGYQCVVRYPQWHGRL